MDRTTRAQQRAAAIDVSPARLAAEIERLIGERDVARRQADLARQELARIQAGGPIASDGGGKSAAKSKAGAALEKAEKERDEYLAALQRERAEFLNFKRRSAEERDAMYGIASEGLIRKVLALADDFDLAVEHRPAGPVDEALDRGHNRHRSQAPSAPRERGRFGSRCNGGRPVRSARARGGRERPRHGAPRR